MSSDIDKEESDLILEIKLALITLILMVIWVGLYYSGGFNMFNLPLVVTTIFLLVFGGSWIIVLRRRKKYAVAKSEFAEKGKIRDRI